MSETRFELPDRPDLVLVVVDALRRDHLGMYGYGPPTSPSLDSLASEGLVFDDALAQSSVTFQSTASLFTSRYSPWLSPNTRFRGVPRANRATNRRHAQVPYLQQANLTLAEALGREGYATFGAFTNPHHHPTSGFFQGFDEARYLPAGRRGRFGRARAVRDTFFEWLDQRSQARPYFALLYLMDVHNPYRPPQSTRELFVEEEGRMLYVNGRPRDKPTPEDIAFMRALYDGEIRRVDGAMESIVAGLRERRRWDRTLLLLTSDHGDEFFEHGGFGHGKTLHLEQIRIPMLVAGAGLAAHEFGSRRLPGLVRNLDIAPTLIEVAGGSVPREFQGRSFLPLIRARANGATDSATSFALVGSLRSVTDGGRHFITKVGSKDRWLYDRRVDPNGMVNVASEYPELIEQLESALAAFERRHEASAIEAAELARSDLSEGVDVETVDQLEALGYLEN